MEKELDLYTATLDEIVFDDRNKSYGGYFLRVWYEKNVSKAVIFTCIAFVVVATSIHFYYKFTAKVEEAYVPVIIDMEPVTEELKAEEKEKLPPPPPKEQPKIEEIKFMPPIIKPDKMVAKEEQINELDSLLNSKVSTQNVAGKKSDEYQDPDNDPSGKIGGTGTEKTEEVFTFAQEMPRFKGTATDAESAKAREKYIMGKMFYPEDAKQRKVEGVVYVKYTITKEGKVTDVQVVPGRGLDPSCDAEAVRVIKSMPDFIPARQSGELRKVTLTQRVKFTLTTQ
ncbi:energy transducer TonB [Cytophaga aurantiaca]|uniref:energy transducer TonB n=1 Tax=Cytophaga aurantiaca TaxID=29530 RepID=UPI00036A9708|nr:energy transducer TonB [Cytophaga aurantiaca]